jgi:hypothetical protein
MLVPLQGIPKGRRESQCLRRAAGVIAINYMPKFELHPLYNLPILIKKPANVKLTGFLEKELIIEQ